MSDKNKFLIFKKMIGKELWIKLSFNKGTVNFSIYHLFKNEKFILVAHKDHPLAKQKITFDELLTFPLFIREEGSGTRAILENYLLQEIYTLSSFQKVIEVQSLTMIKKMLACTQGISFLYEGVVHHELLTGELTQIHLENFELIRPMHFIYLRNNINKQKYSAFFKNIYREKL